MRHTSSNTFIPKGAGKSECWKFGFRSNAKLCPNCQEPNEDWQEYEIRKSPFNKHKNMKLVKITNRVCRV